MCPDHDRPGSPGRKSSASPKSLVPRSPGVHRHSKGEHQGEGPDESPSEAEEKEESQGEKMVTPREAEKSAIVEVVASTSGKEVSISERDLSFSGKSLAPKSPGSSRRRSKSEQQGEMPKESSPSTSRRSKRFSSSNVMETLSSAAAEQENEETKEGGITPLKEAEKSVSVTDAPSSSMKDTSTSGVEASFSGKSLTPKSQGSSRRRSKSEQQGTKPEESIPSSARQSKRFSSTNVMETVSIRAMAQEREETKEGETASPEEAEKSESNKDIPSHSTIDVSTSEKEHSYSAKHLAPKSPGGGRRRSKSEQQGARPEESPARRSKRFSNTNVMETAMRPLTVVSTDQILSTRGATTKKRVSRSNRAPVEEKMPEAKAAEQVSPSREGELPLTGTEKERGTTGRPSPRRRSSSSKPADEDVAEEKVGEMPEKAPAKRVSRSKRKMEEAAEDSATLDATADQETTQPPPSASRSTRSSRSSRSKPAEAEVATEQMEEMAEATPAKRVSRSRRKTEDTATADASASTSAADLQTSPPPARSSRSSRSKPAEDSVAQEQRSKPTAAVTVRVSPAERVKTGGRRKAKSESAQHSPETEQETPAAAASGATPLPTSGRRLRRLRSASSALEDVAEEEREGEVPGTATEEKKGTTAGKPSPRKRRSASMTAESETPSATEAAKATPRSRGTRSESGGGASTTTSTRSSKKRVSRTAAITLEDIPEYQASPKDNVGYSRDLLRRPTVRSEFNCFNNTSKLSTGPN